MSTPYMCGDEMPVYVPDGGCDCNYTIEQVESVDYEASYILKLNGEQVGQSINVPKDVYVSRGTINTVTDADVPYEGAVIGDKYLTLAFVNYDGKVNIPMKELTSASYMIVDELPEEGSSSIIYLVPAQGGGYDRYIYSNGEWVDIGDEQIDLSNYYTKAETDAEIASEIASALTNYYTKEEIDEGRIDFRDISSEITFTTTTGTFQSKKAYQYGRLIVLDVVVKNTSQTASGDNMYAGTLSPAKYRPVAAARSADYTGAHAVIYNLQTNGALYARNASPTSIPNGTSLTGAFTYIMKGTS